MWLTAAYLPSLASVRDYFTKARRPVMQPQQSPSNEYLLQYVISLTVLAVLAIITFRQLRSSARHDLLTACGVSLRKVARSVAEIQRKGFHVAGLLVPLVQLMLLRHGWTNSECVRLCWTITIIGTSMDYARLHSDFVARHWPLRSILREHEHKQLTGGCYFALGCTLCIAVSPPSVAMASILFLVLGDMSAAIIGVSFGGDALGKLRLGREGKKSLEGSLAMFFVCFIIGCTIFPHVRLREYPVFWGALVATLTELHEPLRLNDNLTIPFFSSIAMQLAFHRIASC